MRHVVLHLISILSLVATIEGNAWAAHESARQEDGFSDPVQYVLEKLRDYDVVMIGEAHWLKEEALFVQEVIRRSIRESAIDYVFLELGHFSDQSKVEELLSAPEYDVNKVMDILRSSAAYLNFGRREYFDIFRAVYEENRDLPANERVQLILTDVPAVELSSSVEFVAPKGNWKRTNWRIINWVREDLADRDEFMASVIEVCIFRDRSPNEDRKAIYYAGSHHVRKGLHQKGRGGRRYFTVAGLLNNEYPGKVFSVRLHHSGGDLSSVPSYFDDLYLRHGQPMAFDLQSDQCAHLRIDSVDLVDGNSIPLSRLYDGYIVLNKTDDLTAATIVPQFYTDEYAQKAWEFLRDKGILKNPPPQLARYKECPFTGNELLELMKQGFK